MTLPLEGIRVLDLSRLLPGPFATMLLADFGAEVIKIEDPIQGDYMRWWPPFYTKDTNKESAAFLHLNRNKKSIILDLKDPEGQEIFYRLAEKSDVVLESFRPGVVKKLQIDYDTISRVNSQIIYCSLSGYGQTGPYRDLPGHDVNYLGVAGVASLTGEPDQPKLIGVQVADIGAGSLNTVLAILMSIIARNKTGRGQYIDVSMLDGAMTWLAFAFPRFWASKEIPMRGDDLLTGGRPGYGIYKAKDNKFVAVGALEKKFWRNLCTTIKREDLLEPADMEKKEISEILKKVILTKTRDEWFELSKQTDICISPVYELDEIMADPQVQAREMIVDFKDERFGNIKYIGMPFKLSETPGNIRTRAPGYGEHTEEILRSLNYSTQEIETLRKKEVISPKYK
ncbi:CoA transferase [Candidatus Borrarchaeum sp.]|uniref:CaiB/BaiF CoA transferase family protein n=1 Tax=Candidatus Borrarchaeum sp. TaxID=2846742 RepID=UPI00257AA782|nr:CoA transferase [Candidatus Borrarchaeum sp.]